MILEAVREHPDETAPEIAKRVGRSSMHVFNVCKREGVSLPRIRARKQA